MRFIHMETIKATPPPQKGWEDIAVKEFLKCVTHKLLARFIASNLQYIVDGSCILLYFSICFLKIAVSFRVTTVMAN